MTSIDNETLVNLVDGCVQKSRKAQEMLYKSYFGYALSVALLYSSRHDDALDTVNDSFIKIFTQIGRFDPNFYVSAGADLSERSDDARSEDVGCEDEEREDVKREHGKHGGRDDSEDGVCELEGRNHAGCEDGKREDVKREHGGRVFGGGAAEGTRAAREGGAAGQDPAARSGEMPFGGATTHSAGSLQRRFLGWVRRIVINTAIDKLRRDKLFKRDSEDIELANRADNLARSGAETIHSELNAKEILKLLNYLPGKHKAVFCLYDIEGYTHEEIAKMLSIPESSSRVYLTRARAKLRELYSKNFNG